MKENINNFLKLVKPKNDSELFIALTYLALIFFEKKIIKSILAGLNQLATVACLENRVQSLKAVRVFYFL